MDVRNYGTDKCVKLTIHVSAERAMEVIEAFGWPTNVNPVSVAVAGLKEAAPCAPVNHRLSQQAAMCCQERLFWRYLEQQCGSKIIIDSTKVAATVLRNLAGVESRSEFDTNDLAAKAWQELHGDYLIWASVPA